MREFAPRPRGRSLIRAIGLAAFLACGTAACGVGLAYDPSVPPPGVEEAETTSAEVVDPHPAPGDTTAGTGGYFWRGNDFGTDAYAGPFDVLLNRGMAVAQWEDLSRDLNEIDFQWEAVRRSMFESSVPVSAAGGWREVLSQHVFPFDEENFRRANWVPNYAGHVIEGGISYRRLAEWNRAQGVPFSHLTAAVTSYAAAIVNEAYEMPTGPGFATQDGTPGATVDLLIFDPLGMLLFSFDAPARFFANTLGANVWPTQAAITLDDAWVVNNGQAAIFKLPLPWTDVRLFMRAGMGFEAGLTLPRPDGLNVNLAAGFQSRTRFVDPFDQTESINQSFSAGLWLDRDNTLVASFTYDEKTDRRFAVNVFPGSLELGVLGKPGFFAFLDSDGRPFFGFSTSRTLGLGTGIGF